jgi:aspartate 1-decarboxylase
MKNLLSAKIHGIEITDKNIDYVGSVTIDRVLMDAVGIVPFEKVQIVNLATGGRWETYAVEGEPNSGVFALNGGSARLGEIGDNCLVMSYVVADESSPKVVFLSKGNMISKVCNYKDCPELFGKVME